MPKKVLIFSVTYYPKLVGGDVVAVKEITDRLDPKEYEFHLITLRFDKNLAREEKIGNVFVYRLGFVGTMKESADSLRFPLHYNKYLFPFIGAWKAIRLSKKHYFSLTWSITANYAGFASLFFKMFKPKIPFLLTLQEGDPLEHYKKRVSILYPLFKRIFTRADGIQAISHFLANYGKSMGFKGKPEVVPNGVDVGVFLKDPSPLERIEIRKELGIKEDDVALITTSRLVIKNGIGDVIKALPKLGPNIKFVILGEGYMREELQALAKDLAVRERVIFKGFVPHSQMPKYLKACDIFIRPSLSEGLGNSFIEAMAALLPVIATPVGGIVDFLFEGETGYFCKPENPESIAETVNFVVSDPRRPEVIENAKRMATEKYNWNQITLQMKDIFDNIASK